MITGKIFRYALLSLIISLLTVPAVAEEVSMSLYSVGCPGGHNSGGGEKILTIGPNYEKVILTRACFDDNGYILVNGIEVWKEYNGCCSANCSYPYVDITEYVQPGDNIIYGYADDCCGVCAGASAAFQIEYRTIIDVAIDVKPGSDPNSVQCRSNHVIPVAVLSTKDFDATTINVSRVFLGSEESYEVHGKGHLEDVNGDGYQDMVLHFALVDTGIQCGDSSVTLNGYTMDGVEFTGTDYIRTVPVK